MNRLELKKIPKDLDHSAFKLINTSSLFDPNLIGCPMNNTLFENLGTNF